MRGRTLRAGASGFVLKDDPPEQLLEATRTVAAGDALLSPSVTKRVIGLPDRDPLAVLPRFEYVAGQPPAHRGCQRPVFHLAAADVDGSVSQPRGAPGRIVLDGRRYESVARWGSGERTVRFLIGRGRLETIEASDLAAAADAQIERATRRLEATARAALENGDVDGAYAAAYDSYRMAAEALLARQGLRATGGDGSHMAVEDAASAQFAAEIPALAKPTFERLRRTRHTAQYFDPSAAPITRPDAEWALEKATGALSGVKRLLSASPPGRFE